MVKTYEAMILVDPTTTAKDSSKIPEYIKDILTTNKAKILNESKWAERALAYPIKGHRRGNYYLSYLDAPAENVSKIKQTFELTPGILRFMILAVSPAERTRIFNSGEKIAPEKTEVQTEKK